MPSHFNKSKARKWSKQSEMPSELNGFKNCNQSNLSNDSNVFNQSKQSNQSNQWIEFRESR